MVQQLAVSKYFSERNEVFNRQIQAKCVASITNCGVGLESKQLWCPLLIGDGIFSNDKYWKSFRTLFHITRRPRTVFQLKGCFFPKDSTQYLSGYNSMIEISDFPRWMTQLNLRYSCWLLRFFQWINSIILKLNF